MKATHEATEARAKITAPRDRTLAGLSAPRTIPVGSITLTLKNVFYPPGHTGAPTTADFLPSRLILDRQHVARNTNVEDGGRSLLPSHSFRGLTRLSLAFPQVHSERAEWLTYEES